MLFLVLHVHRGAKQGKLFLSSTLLRPSQTLFGPSVRPSHFSKKLEFEKKNWKFAKKNGICTGFWIFGGRRPAAEGRSQSIEITLTT